jgi:phosphatidylserine/phosphatidylglycerophosphate/cardiolipin synthase-like enzyme
MMVRDTGTRESGMNRYASVVVAGILCAGGALAQVGGRIDADAPRTIEAAFGPEGGAESLVLKVIDSARISVRLGAFALSSPVVVDALVSARTRGVDVQVVVDRRHNIDEDEKGIGTKALTRLAGANIAVRTNSGYRIHHDKFVIVDARHVQTGSYNYAASANKNSENVLVVWNDPSLAAKYLEHWESRFQAGAAFLAQKHR